MIETKKVKKRTLFNKTRQYNEYIFNKNYFLKYGTDTNKKVTYLKLKR